MAKASRATLQARDQMAQMAKELERYRNDYQAALKAAEENARIASDNGERAGRLEAKVAELEQQNVQMGQQVVDQGAKIKELNGTITHHYNAQLVAQRERDTATKENNELRDRLHAMTVSLARTEGAMDIYREFAPVPLRDEYLDRLPTHERRTLNGGFASVSERDFEQQQAPWYRRF